MIHMLMLSPLSLPQALEKNEYTKYKIEELFLIPYISRWNVNIESLQV